MSKKLINLLGFPLSKAMKNPSSKSLLWLKWGCGWATPPHPKWRLFSLESLECNEYLGTEKVEWKCILPIFGKFRRNFKMGFESTKTKSILKFIPFTWWSPFTSHQSCYPKCKKALSSPFLNVVNCLSLCLGQEFSEK